VHFTFTNCISIKPYFSCLGTSIAGNFTSDKRVTCEYVTEVIQAKQIHLAPVAYTGFHMWRGVLKIVG
jgi:hypothetical protein